MKTFPYILKVIISTKLLTVLELFYKELMRRIYSNERIYKFCYDLRKEIEIPDPKIPLNVRPLHKSDIQKLFLSNSDSMDCEEMKMRMSCLLFLRSKIQTCYVGVTEDEIPIVICWLITSDENNRLKSYFKGGIQWLEKNEILLEFVFTNPLYRGLNLMAWLTFSLFKKALNYGAYRAVAYIQETNINSLKGCKKIGWRFSIIKNVKWRIFKRKVTFEPYIRNIS